MTPQSLREEFEKAFMNEFGGEPLNSTQIAIHSIARAYAIWSARWMAEYLLREGFIDTDEVQALRLLAKELE